MAAIERIRVNWTGFIGGPGVSTFYATDAGTLVPQIRTFFNALITQLTAAVKIDVDNVGDVIEAFTGELEGGWTTGVQAQVVGTAAGNYNAVSGALVQWKSDTVLSGRRLRGHSFIVPLASAGYDASGQILNTSRTLMKTAAAALVTASAGNMLVYQRPRKAKPADGSVKAITERSGGYGPVTGSDVRTVVTSLRSRRD